MAVILRFRTKGGDAPGPVSASERQGEIVIFSGVRIDRKPVGEASRDTRRCRPATAEAAGRGL